MSIVPPKQVRIIKGIRYRSGDVYPDQGAAARVVKQNVTAAASVKSPVEAERQSHLEEFKNYHISKKSKQENTYVKQSIKCSL